MTLNSTEPISEEPISDGSPDLMPENPFSDENGNSVKNILDIRNNGLDPQPADKKPPKKDDPEDSEDEDPENDDDNEEEDGDDEDLGLKAKKKKNQPDEEQEEGEGQPEIESEPKKKKSNVAQDIKKLKELRTEAEEKAFSLEEENIELKTKLKAAEETNKKSASRIKNVTDHPVFIEKRDDLEESILEQISVNLDDDIADAVKKTWAKDASAYYEARDLPRGGGERKKATEAALFQIAKSAGLIEGDQEGFSVGIDDYAIEAAKSIAKTFLDHKKKLNEVVDFVANFNPEDDGPKPGEVFKDYEKKAEPLRKRLSAIVQMKESDIEDDPNSLQSFAARKILSDPDGAAAYEAIQASLEQMILGPRALSPEKLKIHEKSGKDLKKFQQAREKRLQDHIQSRLPVLATMLFLEDEIAEALPAFMEKKAKTKRAADRSDILEKGKTVIPTKKKDTDDNTSSIDKLLALRCGDLE